MLKLTIDGREVEVPEGSTILEAAQIAGIRIPTLCYDERLKPFGACRVCLVEVEKAKGPIPSCTTPATDNMMVRTNTPALTKLRKTVLELLLINHPLDCPICDKAGDCELQDLVYEYGITENRFSGPKFSFPLEAVNPFIKRNPNRCILCGKCVRICDEVQGVGAISFVNRGFATRIGTGFDRPLDCDFCGHCISVCPVGALTEKISTIKARSWLLNKVTTTCPYCGCGCQLELNVYNNQVIKVTSDPQKTPNWGSLCVKGRFGHDFIHHPERLAKPLIRQDTRYKIQDTKQNLREVGWDEALSLVAQKLKEIKDKYGPDSIAGLSSAKCTNEENYLFQKFMRAAVGTNNVDHCARLCHASTVAGLAAAFGSGAMTNSIEEIERAEVILVTGSNTTENHPLVALKIKKAVREQGAKLILVEPRKIELTRFATIWLRSRPGTDVAWINGMMHIIIEEGLWAKEYVKSRTEGFEKLRETLKKYTPEYTQRITGIPEDKLRETARIYAHAERASILYAMGITQHITGTDNVKSLANLAMLCGNVGIESGGVNPLRGQNNVQGACDMGALPNLLSGYQPVTNRDVVAMFSKAWGVALSDKPGLTVVEMMDAAREGKLKAMFIMGENPMLSDPDLHHVEEALKKLDFLVVQDIFLTETATLADVVLPSVSFAERDGTFTNTERRVQRVRKAIEPIGEARPDWEIISKLAGMMGYEMRYHSPSDIQEEIAALTPSYGGIHYDRLEGEGLQWPCPNRDHPGTKYLHKDKFVRGLGLFHPIEYLPAAEVPDEKYPLMLNTGRVLFHYHTGSMSRRSKGLKEICPESLVEINPADAQKLGIVEGDEVRVESRRGKIKVKATITDKSPPGVVFMNFHFQEAPANILTNPALDPVGKIPELKVCAVRVEKYSR